MILCDVIWMFRFSFVMLIISVYVLNKFEDFISSEDTGFYVLFI